MTNQKVVVIATGGTIAMRYDPVRRAVFPAVTGRELLEAIPPLSAVCPVEVIEFSNIPSPHMTPQMMFHLAGCIDKILEQADVAGVVVTHGTDTLEETAYLLDLVVKSAKPIVLVGAMRPATAISADGPMNLYNAVALAASREAVGRGVLVCMNDRIDAARDDTQTNTVAPDTFRSPELGVLGMMEGGPGLDGEAAVA